MKLHSVLIGVLGMCATAAYGAQLPPAPAGPVVHTVAGDVSGVRSGDGKVVSFKGVPFAAPPVGNLRWAPPSPVQPWQGVRRGDAFGPSCMQREHTGDNLPWTVEYLDKNQTSEDCLYLNVWTPKPVPDANLAVVVYIHGGAFTEGSGAVPVYDGTHLAATGLVVVTINYRLGVFGFFSHPELTAESPHHSSGNYGLMDQIAALAWVQENIAAFGGDPKRVTIWGQSAGAFSVRDLIASPLPVGLFQRAVADSGIGVTGLPLPDRKAAEEMGMKFAASRHATSLKDLRAMPASDLLPQPTDQGMHYAPVIDGWVLPDTIDALNEKKAGSQVSVITGFQANDGLLFKPTISSMNDYEALVQRQYGDMAEDFKKLYPASTLDEAKTVLTESTRDRERVSAFTWAVQHEQQTARPVYTYYFTRGIPWPQHPEFGAFHSGELPYFFLNLNVLDRPWDAADRRLARDCAAYLKNFAETGNPNNTNLPDWEGVHAETPETMELGTKIRSMPVADKARVDFWIKYFDSQAAKNAPPF